MAGAARVGTAVAMLERAISNSTSDRIYRYRCFTVPHVDLRVGVGPGQQQATALTSTWNAPNSFT
jgi:hypothetical protein